MKVIGIGGIFFKSEQQESLSQWYQQHLGISGTFVWKDVDNNAIHRTSLKAHPGSSRVFEGTAKNLVIKYIVDDLKSFLEKMKNDSIRMIGEIEYDENEMFACFMDPEGNKFFLWESDAKEPRIETLQLNKVTGLGGVFFKSPEPKKLSQWYADHLGLDATEWGCNFLWHDPNNPNAKSPAMTVWNPFAADTTYFNPSKSDFMFNYRVLNLAELLKKLEASGVQLAGDMQEFSYGKFGWIVDPDGNKVELWEPIDDGF